ncbi:MAG: hypothetical protein MR227_00850 [Firmicutes bacterium]|nr:hypothetical protein [Bacillota bacterium]
MKTENELILHIYESSQMGIEAINNLLNELKNKENKIKKILEDELKEYEKFYKSSEKLLKKEKIELKEKGKMAKMMAKIGIKKEVLSDNSDSKIAQMLTQGLTMGVTQIAAKIDSYKDVISKNHMELAKNYKKFQENSIEKLKSYL